MIKKHVRIIQVKMFFESSYMQLIVVLMITELWNNDPNKLTIRVGINGDYMETSTKENVYSHGKNGY